jgi:hypothetical protein
MTEMNTAKYIRTGVTRPSNHPEVTAPIIIMNSDENYGDMGFTMYWEPVTQPFVMNPDNHNHLFPQYLRVDRPMIFIDLFFARTYRKKSSQS